MDSDLFGPDVSEAPHEPIDDVGDEIEVSMRQFVNRWVFLPHQRATALAELRLLLAPPPPQGDV